MFFFMISPIRKRWAGKAFRISGMIETQSERKADVWPRLTLDEWAPTQTTLQRWTQIVGKTRLALAPMQNHWWQVVLYETAANLAKWDRASLERGPGWTPPPSAARGMNIQTAK